MRPKNYIASDHDIDPSLIDKDALFVISKLKEAGYKAYLVGGSVRDLLVKTSPKDYDISTSAKPDEIKRVFGRRCLLIGRRFRLAHIRFGHKVIEVSTFRSGANEEGLIVRDNQWGTEEEDVIRRDFTINGLFYDPETHTVIDYVGGWDDIHQRLIRSIGDPVVRFKQDPVRMIRLLKFRARFGFEIDEEAKLALVNCRKEIIKSSPARLLEEFLRMLESTASGRFLYLLKESGILVLIFPALAEFVKRDIGKHVFEMLAITDTIKENQPHRPIDRAVLASCLVFPILEEKLCRATEESGAPLRIGDIAMEASTVIRDTLVASFSHFPKRITATISYILTSQYRMTPLSGRSHYRTKILRNKEFPLALKFLKIRALHNPSLFETYTSWRNLFLTHINQQRRNGHHHPSPGKRP